MTVLLFVMFNDSMSVRLFTKTDLIFSIESANSNRWEYCFRNEVIHRENGNANRFCFFGSEMNSERTLGRMSAALANNESFVLRKNVFFAENCLAMSAKTKNFTLSASVKWLGVDVQIIHFHVQ